MSEPLTAAGAVFLEALLAQDRAGNLTPPVDWEHGIRKVEAEAAARAVDEAREMADFIVKRFPSGYDDWACAECRPHSDMLKPGFQCVPHLAAALVAHLRGPR